MYDVRFYVFFKFSCFLGLEQLSRVRMEGVGEVLLSFFVIRLSCIVIIVISIVNQFLFQGFRVVYIYKCFDFCQRGEGSGIFCVSLQSMSFKRRRFWVFGLGQFWEFFFDILLRGRWVLVSIEVSRWISCIRKVILQS